MDESAMTRFWRSLWFVVSRSLIFSSLILLIVLAIFFVPLFPPIYYADYNNIRSRIEKIPNIEIVDVWMNEDLTLEDFSFTLQKPSCPPVTITFHQLHSSRWRANFQSFEGVILFKIGDSGWEEKQISQQELLDANLPIKNINDVLEHLEPLLAYFDTQAPVEDEIGIWGGNAAYAHLTYQGGVCSNTTNLSAKLSP